MPKPILAVAGDLHLSQTVYKRLPGMRGDAHFALTQLADHCLFTNTDLALAGDVFDSRRPDSSDVQALRDAVSRLGSKGLKVYGIQGQHDMSSPSWMEVVGAKRLTHKPVTIGNLIVLAGLDYHPRPQIQERLKDVGYCDVLVLHQMMKESIGYADEENPNYDLELADLPAAAKLVIMGDNHSGWSDPEHKPPVYYTGSTHMRSNNEPTSKFFLVVHDDLSVERVPLSTRPFLKYELVSEERLTECLKELRGAGIEGPASPVSEPFALIRFDRKLENALERIRIAAGDRVFFQAIPYQSVEQIGEETEVVEGSVTLEGCLDELVDPKKQSELNAFVRELLAVEDPREAVTRWREKLVGEPNG